MFEKILIVRKMSSLEYYYNGNHRSNTLKLSDEEQTNSLKEIESIVKASGTEYQIAIRKELNQNFVNKFDLLISAGGDGTVIASAAYNKDTLQLNVRLDKMSKGHLCHKNIRESLRKIFEGEFNIEKWVRQDVYLNEKFIGRALNETCIGESMNFSKMAKYTLNKEYQRNSGLILVTGTGSTGWPSAFKKYPQSSEIFRYKTILPAEGNKEGKGKKFIIKYKGHEGKFAIDTINYNFPRSSVLEIKLSENPLKVVKIK